MGLETATYIDGLVATNPTGTDGRSQGDDHLRLIKGAIKNTFPNINKAVSVTADQINQLGSAGVVPVRGMIMMWYGQSNQVPAGWLICDGANGTPDMRNRFVYGAGLQYGPGQYGGREIATFGGSVDGTALTVAQIPPHTHGLQMGYTDLDQGNVGGGRTGSYGTQQTLSQGGGQPHAHTYSGSVNVIPPFIALFFIMKA